MEAHSLPQDCTLSPARKLQQVSQQELNRSETAVSKSSTSVNSDLILAKIKELQHTWQMVQAQELLPVAKAQLLEQKQNPGTENHLILKILQF